VKCIYIDPPYNTGNESWVYSDNVSSPTIKEWQGKVVGKEGEDLTRHDKWLCMMTPRLRLLRELLAEDGIIFISIDENEVHHLRFLIDEIFGEENFIADFIWENKYTTSNNIVGVSGVHEYILCYIKDAKNVGRAIFRLPYTEEARARYKNPDNDPRGDWMDVSYHGPKSPSERPNLNYPIVHPKTGEKIWPVEKSWAYEKAVYDKHVQENRLWWGKDSKYSEPRLKKFFNEIQGGIIPNTLLTNDDVGGTSDGRADLRDLFGNGEAVFDNPKPVSLISKLLLIGSNKDSVILDSFAGSGTTAHAVMNLNKLDRGNRKVILVEMEDYADKLTAERVRRAAKKYEYEEGFTYHTLGQAIDAESLLTGKLPSYKEFAKYVYYLATGKNHPNESKIDEARSLVGKGDGETVYLLYKKDMDALKSLAITLDWAQETHAKDKGKKIVYAPACYLDDETLDQYNITFVSVPYNLFEKAG
jgi:adenine specific DNA methylase Mod